MPVRRSTLCLRTQLSGPLVLDGRAATVELAPAQRRQAVPLHFSGALLERYGLSKGDGDQKKVHDPVDFF